jgi:hypothetical protein
MAGRPPGAQNKDKPVRDALRIEAALLEKGEDSPAKPGSLRHSARAMLIRAGEDTATFKEVADRLDGKPAQAIIGGEEDDPAVEVVTRIELVALDGNPSD